MRLKIAYFSDSFGASLLYWGGPLSLSALELGMVAVEPPAGRVKVKFYYYYYYYYNYEIVD